VYLGTPAYMAPEQISGAENVDSRTDIYAAGIVLYEAVTGTVPFAGATLFDLMRAHLEEAPRPPRERRPDLPASYEAVILQALAKDPSHRFQSATAMAQALAHATQALPPEAWRPLATRGGPRISASGVGPPTPNPTPMATPGPLPGGTTERQPTPGAFRSTAVAPKTEARTRRTGLIIAAAALIAIVAGITVIATNRRRNRLDRVAVTDPRSASGSGAASASASGSGSASGSASESGSASGSASESGSASASGPASESASGSASESATAAASKRTPTTKVATAQQPLPTRSSSSPIDAGLDPSVHIGPNVHIGPGVTIGGTPVTPTVPTAPPASKSTITKPADYTAKRFDPIAYLPKALALAQQLLPDAKLTSFEFDPVFPDGHVDLTMDGRDREYNFRSPSASARPAGAPRNLPIERACMVHVEVGATEVTATVRKNDDCNARLVRNPTSCRFAGVWKQAIANGTPTDVVARIGWLFDEKWFFDVDFEGKGGGVSTFPDRCP
jgi:serine/threonine protein kinase